MSAVFCFFKNNLLKLYIMKQKLLFLFFCLLISSSVCAQTVGQVDDFDTPANEQGWKHDDFGTSPNPPSMQTTGGIDGNFLKNISTGVMGAGGRFLIRNVSQWTGNYISAGIESISVQVRNNSAVPVNLRYVIRKTSENSNWISTSSVDVPATSGWVTVVFPITEINMTQTGNTTPTYSDVLSACDEVRIVSVAGSPDYRGDRIVADVDFDNITAHSYILSTKKDKLTNAFSISPNPGRDNLNLRLSKLNNNTTVMQNMARSGHFYTLI